jgi:hypothetical protein
MSDKQTHKQTTVMWLTVVDSNHKLNIGIGRVKGYVHAITTQLSPLPISAPYIRFILFSLHSRMTKLIAHQTDLHFVPQRPCCWLIWCPHCGIYLHMLNSSKHSSKCTYHLKSQVFWNGLGLLDPEDEGKMNLLNVSKVTKSQKTSIFSNTAVRISNPVYVPPLLILRPFALLTQHIYASRVILTRNTDYYARLQSKCSKQPQSVSVFSA